MEVVKSDIDELVDTLKKEVGDPQKDKIDMESLDQFVERRVAQIKMEKEVGAIFLRRIFSDYKGLESN
jgi:hypothetical protein